MLVVAQERVLFVAATICFIGIGSCCVARATVLRCWLVVTNNREEEKAGSHIHAAFYGSTYACSFCNRVCSENHSFGNRERLSPCSVVGCPLRQE